MSNLPVSNSAMKPYEELPSGKVIIRRFDEGGSLVREQQTYRMLDIGISYDFKEGTKVDEAYFVKRRLVSRRTYEKARTAYADMPAADASLGDGWQELLRGAAKEQRRHSAEAKQHRPDPGEGRKNDEFCSTLMNKGKTENAVKWIQAKSHTLGERNWSNSKRLVDRLSALGCVHVCACEIDVYPDHSENTGHLVIELPTAATARGQILKVINRLAREQGYEGPFDDSQRYAYVKLD